MMREVKHEVMVANILEKLDKIYYWKLRQKNSVKTKFD